MDLILNHSLILYHLKHKKSFEVKYGVNSKKRTEDRYWGSLEEILCEYLKALCGWFVWNEAFTSDLWCRKFLSQTVYQGTDLPDPADRHSQFYGAVSRDQ